MINWKLIDDIGEQIKIIQEKNNILKNEIKEGNEKK